jgi:hypothetical protein
MEADLPNHVSARPGALPTRPADNENCHGGARPIQIGARATAPRSDLRRHVHARTPPSLHVTRGVRSLGEENRPRTPAVEPEFRNGKEQPGAPRPTRCATARGGEDGAPRGVAATRVLLGPAWVPTRPHCEAGRGVSSHATLPPGARSVPSPFPRRRPVAHARAALHAVGSARAAWSASATSEPQGASCTEAPVSAAIRSQRCICNREAPGIVTPVDEDTE